MSGSVGRESALVRALLGQGVRASCLPMPAAHTVAVAVYVRAGPRFESASNAGISHFLEHMLHRGTRRHPSAYTQALAFEELGATLSAATYVDHGVLSVSVPPENYERVVELLAEVCLDPVFDNIELERGIVREELLEGLDAAGRHVDPENLLRAACFPDHGLGLPIIGTPETLSSFDEPALRAHHRGHYTTRMVVTVAGKIDENRALSVVERVFRPEPGIDPASTPPAEPRGPTLRYVSNRSSQTALRVGFRAPSERDTLEPATEILLRVLDDGMSTRLYHRLCDERGLCYDVSATYEAYGDAGLFDVSAETSHEQALEVMDEMFGIFRALRDEGASAAEVQKAQARYRWQLDEIIDVPSELTAFYGLGELTGVARTLEERAEQLSSVSVADVKRAAESLFVGRNLTVAAVGSLPRKARNELERRLKSLS
jgi:predicted Zn-dependent peptidase